MQKTLNIISNSFQYSQLGGPNKVIQNTLKGLDRIHQNYVVNDPVLNHRYNWIHDSVEGLIDVSIAKIPAIVGPNLVVLPKDLPHLPTDLNHLLYLQPSHWCVEIWKILGFNRCPLISWPVGIDTDEFNIHRTKKVTGNVMIYFKRRNPLLLNTAISLIKDNCLNPIVIEYGNYDEVTFKKILKESDFGIWIGISESQGIALQEALASNLPLIICDVNTLFESSSKKDYRFPKELKSFKPTSAPYFDETCGIKINDINHLNIAIKELIKDRAFFSPREYILKNLSLEKQAQELMSLFDLLIEPRVVQLSKKSSKISTINRIKSKTSFLYYVFKKKMNTLHKLLKNSIFIYQQLL